MQYSIILTIYAFVNRFLEIFRFFSYFCNEVGFEVVERAKCLQNVYKFTGQNSRVYKMFTIKKSAKYIIQCLILRAKFESKI